MYDPLVHTFTTPHGHPIVMAYRDDTNDWNTLTASLNEDEYGLPSDLEGVALDIGGYLGSVGIALALDNPGLRVVIVEPVPSNIALIRTNIRANDVGARVHLIEGAVGRGTETVQVAYGFAGDHVAEHHAFVGNSSLVMQAPVREYIEYAAVSLEFLVAMAGGDVAYMKIDTEGAEYPFLDSPGVAKVETIVGEWHNNDGHVIGDILALLDATHTVTFTGPQAGPGGFTARRR